jgi:hypothetical protein
VKNAALKKLEIQKFRELKIAVENGLEIVTAPSWCSGTRSYYLNTDMFELTI